MKDDEEMQDEGEEELEKEGSDLDFVKEKLQEASGGVEALSQALEGIQDPKLKEIMQAIYEDETKHQAALEQWVQENGGGDAEEGEPGEDDSPEPTEKEDGGVPEIEEDEGDGGKADLIDQIRAVLEAHDDEAEKACDEESTERADDGDKDEDDKPDFLKGDGEGEEDGKITKSFRVPIIKGDQQICYGIVSKPDVVDLQGDRLSETEIRKACHKFMQKSQQINKEHEGPAKADIIESYIAPVSFTCGGQTVRKGSWVMAVKIYDKSLWDAVKKGEITGFSIAGQGERTPFS